MTTTKLLFDTDIGTDIDDAVCLAYLLAQPRCELLGITTVTECDNQRAMLAGTLCRAAGIDIPIFPGTSRPLVVAPRQTSVPQAGALAQWPHPVGFKQGEAIAFMRDTIRSHPGEVVLLATGPMTNLALLFALDPELPTLLKSLVMMCGVFTARPVADASGPALPPVEWNAQCDPHAAAEVYRATASTHRSIGLDVTQQVMMSAGDVRQRFTAKLLQPVLSMATAWFESGDTITFHDPLAATTIFDEDQCGFKRGNVDVVLDEGTLCGRTLFEPDARCGRHEVALSVSPQRFFEHYFEVVNSAG
jgi:inosine-uridine nucleoside N-ribohydrolase